MPPCIIDVVKCVFPLLFYLARARLEPIPSLKCSDERTDVFDNCSVNYRDMTMWCDKTNFTAIPHPKSSAIITQTEAEHSKVLHLNDSCVLEIDPNIMGHYSELVHFNCENNDLTFIGANTFYRNSKLSILILAYNRIAIIEDGAFTGLNELQVLNLQNNKLNEITEFMFASLAELLKLNVANNQLVGLSERPFRDLQNLQSLNLSGNYLKFITPNDLFGLNSLRVLDLHNNKLTSPSVYMFLSTPFLVTIDLSHNNISCLPRKLFSDVKSLAIIKLGNNQLKVPKSEWFGRILLNNRIDLYQYNILTENPWTCDCNSYRYWEFLVQNVTALEWKHLLDLDCHSPAHLNRRRLSLLSESEFNNCADEPRVMEDCTKIPGSSQILPEGKDTTTHLHVDVTFETKVLGKEQNPETTSVLPFELGLIIGILILALCALMAYCIYQRKSKTSKTHATPGDEIEQMDTLTGTCRHSRDSGFMDVLPRSSVSSLQSETHPKQLFSSSDMLQQHSTFYSSNEAHSKAPFVPKVRNDSGCYTNCDSFAPHLDAINENLSLSGHTYEEVDITDNLAMQDVL